MKSKSNKHVCAYTTQHNTVLTYLPS